MVQHNKVDTKERKEKSLSNLVAYWIIEDSIHAISLDCV